MNISLLKNWKWKENQENKSESSKMSLATLSPSPTIWKQVLLFSALSLVLGIHLSVLCICAHIIFVQWMLSLWQKTMTVVGLLVLFWVLRRHRDRPAFLSGLSSHNWSPFLQWLSCCCWAAQHLGLTVRFFHSLYVLFPRLKNWVCFWSYLEIPVSAWLLLIRFIWKETVLQDKLEKCQAATLTSLTQLLSSHVGS